MVGCPGANSVDVGDKCLSFPSARPGTGQNRAEGGGGEEREEKGREEERVWEGGRGRKETLEEGGRAGGRQGQREQGSLTGGHSGLGDT